MGSITPINVVARVVTSMPSERSMRPRGSATSISRIASAGTSQPIATRPKPLA